MVGAEAQLGVDDPNDKWYHTHKDTCGKTIRIRDDGWCKSFIRSFTISVCNVFCGNYYNQHHVRMSFRLTFNGVVG